VQHELGKAVAAPLAVKQRAAAKAVAQAEETLTRVHERCDHANGEPAKRGPGRPPKVTPCLEQAAQAVRAAQHEHQRLTGQRMDKNFKRTFATAAGITQSEGTVARWGVPRGPSVS
jgi:hypothetical protein